jgi:hypothetical protein
MVRPRKPALCQLSYAGIIWYPWRESNSHPQLRKLSLYPLSYRGMACAPGRTRTCNRRSRKPVRYPLRYKGIGAIGGVEPSTVEPQSTVLPLHYDRHGKLPLGQVLRRWRESNPQPRVTRRLVSTELHYPSATSPSASLVSKGCIVRVENRGIEPLASCLQGRRSFRLS